MDQKTAPSAFINNFHGNACVQLQLSFQLLPRRREERALFHQLHSAARSHRSATVRAKMQLSVVIAGFSDVVVGIFDGFCRLGVKD